MRFSAVERKRLRSSNSHSTVAKNTLARALWPASATEPVLGRAQRRLLADRHEYELYQAVEDIDHSRTKARSPQTNGIFERLHKTMLDERAEMLHADLDDSMATYDEQRTHQGKWRFGKTPMQTFLDSADLAPENQNLAKAA